ncbi:MAG: hypothetical protein IBX70_07540 [Clostridia bacterium]|nr:hypothetical protein [Clostridia bacterium]
MLIIKELNSRIDNQLIKAKLKTKPLSDFEKNQTDFLQSLLLNLNSGMTLEESLQLAIKSAHYAPELIHQSQLRQSAISGLNHFSLIESSDKVWRMTRLINQTHKTGNSNLVFAINKLYEELWMEKTSEFKKKSEKVSIQLTFLLMLSLISVIVIVVSPIIIIF